jgi:prepilin-type N-terminal cleavage/methylation domain-containing protein
MQRTPARIRCGFTLLELALVCAIVGLVSAVGLRGLARHLERSAVRNATSQAAAALARARDEALARHTIVLVRIDTIRGVLTLRDRDGPLARYALGQVHGVSLATTRDSIAFDARGLGYGAANLTLVARRGTAADTLVVSRLGRTRS